MAGKDITPRRRGNSPMPYELFKDFFGRDLVDDFFGRDIFAGFGPGVRADIKETDKEFIVEAELPGFSKEDIEIELVDDRLTISAKRDENTDEKGDNYIRRERRYGEVSRSFMVHDVKNEEISAEYNNGVLKIVLPKNESSIRKTRRIDIQ